MAEGGTPGSSSHLRQPSPDEVQDTILHPLEEARKSKSDVKKLALTRDNHRCVVTGAYDGATFQERLRIDSTFQAPALPQFTRTAHIFPDSLNQYLAWPDGVLGKKADYSATARAVMERFGQVNVTIESLNSPSIHRVDNVLTMCSAAHQLFDRLELWFEATNVFKRSKKLRPCLPAHSASSHLDIDRPVDSTA
ncbi:hypothetical protein FRC04_003927 [Tulasnella sp. 424]|nr:hypothetical protein FRC04_003927 [Tulasnella sp. 424]